MACFVFNGQSSKKYGLKILNSFEFRAPRKSYEFIEIDGRDGDLTIDNNRLEPFAIDFPVVLRCGRDLDRYVKGINDWLYSAEGYQKLEFTGLNGYYYEALFLGQNNILEELRTRGSGVISFKVKPLKRATNGDEVLTVTNGQKIVNTEAIASKPHIYIEGMGADVVLKIGTEELKIKTLDGNLFVDAERGIASKDGKYPQYHQVVSYPFPSIKPGTQTISWNRGITKLKLIPRWVSY